MKISLKNIKIFFYEIALYKQQNIHIICLTVIVLVGINLISTVLTLPGNVTVCHANYEGYWGKESSVRLPSIPPR